MIELGTAIPLPTVFAFAPCAAVCGLCAPRKARLAYGLSCWFHFYGISGASWHLHQLLFVIREAWHEVGGNMAGVRPRSTGMQVWCNLLIGDARSSESNAIIAGQNRPI